MEGKAGLSYLFLPGADMRIAAALASPVPFLPFSIGSAGGAPSLLESMSFINYPITAGNLGYGDLLLGILQSNAGFFNPTLGLTPSLGSISQSGSNTINPFAVATIASVGTTLYIPFLPLVPVI